MFSGFLIGLLLGVLLQRSQFCFVSGFRLALQRKNFHFLSTLLIAIFVQSVGLFSLNSLGILSFPTSNLPLAATIVGGIFFGCGMVLANCCGSGAWFRSAEGALGSLIALFAFALTLASAQSGALKSWLNPWLQQGLALNTFHQSLNISPWWLVAFIGICALLLSLYQLRQSEPAQHSTFHRLPFWLSGGLIGLLGGLAWYSSAQTGRNFGFGISVPTANVIQYVVTGQQRYLNWGTGFVFGIFIGALFCAKICGEFNLRVPPAREILRRICGGCLMGLGAALAGGCTITNSLVATAYFSWQGWVATFSILFGMWLTYFCLKLTQTKI